MMTRHSRWEYLEFSHDHPIPYLGPLREQPEFGFLYVLEQVPLILYASVSLSNT